MFFLDARRIEAVEIIGDRYRKAVGRSESTRWLPMKPAPPVTRMCVMDGDGKVVLKLLSLAEVCAFVCSTADNSATIRVQRLHGAVSCAVVAERYVGYSWENCPRRGAAGLGIQLICVANANARTITDG